jgi:hypothetical protein
MFWPSEQIRMVAWRGGRGSQKVAYALVPDEGVGIQKHTFSIKEYAACGKNEPALPKSKIGRMLITGSIAPSTNHDSQ